MQNLPSLCKKWKDFIKIKSKKVYIAKIRLKITAFMGILLPLQINIVYTIGKLL